MIQNQNCQNMCFLKIIFFSTENYLRKYPKLMSTTIYMEKSKNHSVDVFSIVKGGTMFLNLVK